MKGFLHPWIFLNIYAHIITQNTPNTQTQMAWTVLHQLHPIQEVIRLSIHIIHIVVAL